jgi:hypothetical protein
MEKWSWYEFNGIVIFKINNLQSMDLFFALNLVSRYIDQYGEEYIIESVADSVGVNFNDYEFITNLPYEQFNEINSDIHGFSFENGEYHLNNL